MHNKAFHQPNKINIFKLVHFYIILMQARKLEVVYKPITLASISINTFFINYIYTLIVQFNIFIDKI